MEDQVLRKEQNLLSSDKKNEELSKICDALCETLEASRQVQNRVLLDFSRLTSMLIYDGLYDGIPEKYEALAEEIDDYWRYDAASDTDRERCLSYARLYQITSMVRIFERERQHAKTLSDLAERNRNNYELLKLINTKPNITYKEICVELCLPSSTLSHRMTQLESQGLLDSRRLGKNKFYSLSFSGMNLFRYLDEMDQVALERMWTSKRLLAISSILKTLALARREGSIDSDGLLRLLREMDQWDDNVVSKKAREWQTSNIDYDLHKTYVTPETSKWNGRLCVNTINPLAAD